MTVGRFLDSSNRDSRWSVLQFRSFETLCQHLGIVGVHPDLTSFGARPHLPETSPRAANARASRPISLGKTPKDEAGGGSDEGGGKGGRLGLHWKGGSRRLDWWGGGMTSEFDRKSCVSLDIVLLYTVILYI